MGKIEAYRAAMANLLQASVKLEGTCVDDRIAHATACADVLRASKEYAKAFNVVSLREDH